MTSRSFYSSLRARWDPNLLPPQPDPPGFGQYLREVYERVVDNPPAFGDSLLFVSGEGYGGSDKRDPVWDNNELFLGLVYLSLRYGILYAGQEAGKHID